MNNYTIRKLEPDEFHLLIPLMQDCFGIKVDVKYFEWKFLNNPAGYFVGFIAVAGNGETAGYYGVIPEMYIVDGKEITIYQSCDTMTHSKHRRKGLFQKLALHCYEFLRNQNKLFVIGFGGGESTPGFLKFGWVRLFHMRFYFYPKLFSYFHIGSGKGSVEEEPDLGKIEKAILKSNDMAAIHSHKTLQIFKWRISNPRFNYKLLTYRQEDGLGGSYLCYYLQGDKIILFDFYFADKVAMKKLMGELKIILRRSTCKGIVAFCQEKSHYSKKLRKANFITNPFPKGPLSTSTPFIHFAPEEVMKRNSNAEQWLISSFDHDAM